MPSFAWPVLRKRGGGLSPFQPASLFQNMKWAPLLRGVARPAPETATFAAGCFWHVEWVFQRIPGVLATRVGYAGGWVPHPSYELVLGGETGHAESVQVDFDPRAISYRQLLDVFWKCHDPTQVDAQGDDVGTQYRSVIFLRGPEQRMLATASREEWQREFRRPIATAMEPFKRLWDAEDYHQQYLQKQGAPVAKDPALLDKRRLDPLLGPMYLM